MEVFRAYFHQAYHVLMEVKVKLIGGNIGGFIGRPRKCHPPANWAHIPQADSCKRDGIYIQGPGSRGMSMGRVVADDIVNQTHQVLKNLFYVLEASGATFSDVIKTTVYLTDMGNFLKMNEIYAHYFQDHKPVRSTVAVKELPKGVLIEMDCVAVANANFSMSRMEGVTPLPIYWKFKKAFRILRIRAPFKIF